MPLLSIASKHIGPQVRAVAFFRVIASLTLP